MSKPSSSRLTPLSRNAAASPPKLNPDLAAIGACTLGHYPWDDWHRYALAQGVSEELAGLGWLLVREAFNHAWDRWLQSLCGWSDDLSAGSAQAGGQGLIDLALRSPKEAKRQWDILMRTDGLRGDYPPSRRSGVAGKPRSRDWTWGYLRADARRFWRSCASKRQS